MADDRSGLLLPSNVVQPFFLRYQPDDLHIIAFISGHPAYEAIEAMVSRRPDGGADVRAIVTRRDQSQVDHINNAAGLRAMRGAAREVCEREISFDERTIGDSRRARISFVSFAGETIDLDVTTLGPPVRTAGGLTDPGEHSATSNLPIMWRGASALGGPGSGVSINGVRFEAEPSVRLGSVATRKAFYTEQFSMGAVRAGEVALRLVRAPERMQPGAEWRFDSDEGGLEYRIVERAEDGLLRIDRVVGPQETILAIAVGDRLRMRAVRIGSKRAGRRLTLSFDEPGRFNFDMESEKGLIAGDVRVEESGGVFRIGLDPTEPDWARPRRLAVSCATEADSYRFVTTIGGE